MGKVSWVKSATPSLKGKGKAVSLGLAVDFSVSNKDDDNFNLLLD